MSHVAGMGYLIQQRGPDSYRSPLSRGVLQGFSLSSVKYRCTHPRVEFAYTPMQMIQSVQYRQRTFLGTEEWRTNAWVGCSKEPDIRLYELGFDLGSLKEDCDKAGVQDGKLSLEDSMEFVNRFSIIDSHLDAWFEGYEKETTAPLFRIADHVVKIGMENETFKPLIFSRLREASNTLGYWGLKLVVSHAITEISMALLANNPCLSSIANTQTREKLEKVIGEHGGSHCLHLATNITRTIPYVLDDSMGLIGAQHALFPLRAALFTLSRYPGEELRRCRAVYAQFDQKKGLHYATEVAKRDERNAEGRGRSIAAQGTNESEWSDEGSLDSAFYALRP